jgi:hypothetical protein
MPNAPSFLEDQMRPIRVSRVAACATFAVIALAASVQGVRAQTLPPAKTLLEKHDAAVGGRAALGKHTSMHQTVALTIAAANLSGTMETYHTKPNLYLMKQSFAGGELLSGFDGKTAWAIAPGQGAQVLDSATTVELKGQADFFGDYYDPTRLKSAETVEITDFEGQRCYKVKIVHTDDTEAMVYFDSATGLRAGQTATAKMMGQEMQTTVVMSSYKDFGGVKMSTHRIQRLPMGEVVMDITAVEFDKVDAATYALPDAVKALVKP